jgi:tetratricopeptide (TPR) repeat protein
MSHLYFKPSSTPCVLAFALAAVSTLSAAAPPDGQTPADQSQSAATLPPATKQASSPKAAAYYHFALGHLYEEMAATYSNRSDYVNKAIENFRLAMKEDPSASFLVQDIAELYRVSGRIREAVEEAQNALKANPDDLNARRVLAHIYTQQISGEPQTNRVDEGMAQRAVEQYRIITAKDPKDLDSLVMLGRLDRVLNNSVDAEAAFKKVLAADPNNEDAVTGLASVYADRGDSRTASALLENLTKKNPSARPLAMLASNYEAMHEYALAADAYRKAIELDPNRIELKAALAQDEALAGQYDDALKTYQEIADANPQDGQAYLGMSQIYLQQKKFDMARKMNDKAKEADPDNLEVRYNEVQILEQEGKLPDAIATLKAMLDSTARKSYDESQRAPRVKMLEQLGLLYRENEQYDQSVETFRQIAALDPSLAPRAEAQIIDTYRLSKDFAKAQQESDAAGAKYPNDRTLTQVRAQLLADQGNAGSAIAELKKLLDGKNDREVYLAMADVYQKTHNYSQMGKVLDAADKLSQTNEDKASVLFMRGAMYERQKKYEQAEAIFRQVLNTTTPTDSTYASTLNYLGYMFADQNIRLPEAQDLIKRAVSIEPNNYAFLDSLGWVYFRLNRLEEAEQQLTRSLQLNGKDPTIHDHLGDVYFKRGKIKEAIVQWQSSLKEWSTSAPADVEPEEVAKVQKKLDSARVRLAKEQAPARTN